MGFFTPQERFIILFLIFLLVLSTSIYLYKLNHPSFAPAYIIEDFKKKIEEERIKEEVIDYNLSLPEQEETRTLTKKKEPLKGKININSAGFNELQRIPGIGPAYSKKIIEYRKKHKGFKNIAEIKRIKGIGEKKFEKMKNYITIK
ncbi:MAG: helix-hairpin-helix domain-containing protein [Candidatus Cloacimonadota bacterium]|nr:MAG: helix-hairpin-helix domain-containing protein [Candidatus Cloacimonadota bacterium]